MKERFKIKDAGFKSEVRKREAVAGKKESAS
jgi:hypothetical protein